MKINIWMADGSVLKEVDIFTNKELGDSIVDGKYEAEELLDGESQKIVYFSGKYVQGGFIPQMILEYEIIDDEPDVLNAVVDFLDNKKNITDMFGCTNKYMANWIVKNRDELLKILR